MLRKIFHLLFLLSCATLVLGQGVFVPGAFGDARLAQESPRKFWALTVATALASAADGWQTAQRREVQSPWLYGTWPGEHRARLGATLSAEFAVGFVFSQILSHRHNRYWAVPQGAVLAAHAAGAVHNCAVADCR